MRRICQELSGIFIPPVSLWLSTAAFCYQLKQLYPFSDLCAKSEKKTHSQEWANFFSRNLKKVTILIIRIDILCLQSQSWCINQGSFTYLSKFSLYVLENGHLIIKKSILNSDILLARLWIKHLFYFAHESGFFLNCILIR